MTIVVVFHAGLPLPGGFTGVDMFFVISGFVITRLLLGEFSRTGTIDFRAFYERRVRRLLPGLAVVTLFTIVAATVLEPPLGAQQTTGNMARATSLFLANIEAWRQPSGYFGSGSLTDPLLHMWSLGVEEQFYLFFPATLLLVGLLARRRGSSVRGALTTLLLTAGSVSLLLCWLASRHHSEFAFFWLPTRAWEFAAGSILAILAPTLERAVPRLLGMVMSAAGLGVVLLSAFVIKSAGFPGLMAVVPVFGAALVIAGGTVSGGGVSRLLATRPFIEIGNMSYSWYLWHWPLLVLMRAAVPDARWPALVGAAVSLVPAWLSYRFLENPIRHRPRERRQTLALTAACVLIPCLAGTTLSTLANYGWWSAHNRSLLRQARTNALADNDRCLIGGLATQPQITACQYRTPDSRGLIVLAGDSHAAALSNGVVGAGNALGYDVQVTAASACPFTSWSRIQNQETFNCGQVFDWTMSEIRHQAAHIGLVVISQADAAHVTTLATEGVSHPLRSWTRSVRSVLTELSADHIPVLLVLDVPKITAQPDACRYGAILKLDCRVSRAWVNAKQGPSWRSETVGARGLPGVSVLSLVSRFCTERACSALQRGRLMYYDNQHLDRAGSFYVEPQLREAMTRALAKR